MASQLPEGESVPDDGSLPDAARERLGRRPFGIYLHVPFCATRCGYCDFNTYTATELGNDPGASRAGYIDAAISELRMARGILGEPTGLDVATVFIGGGTPTLLQADDLGRALKAIDAEFGLAPDVEVTVESNPESVDPSYLERLRTYGVNRISFGMQSARPHVLRVLDRQHTPGRPEQCVSEARAAGFEHVNLDVIYGTPGESDEDWRATLNAAIDAGPDHISAYALIVEDGTRLAASIRRGEVDPTDDDVHADRYLIADRMLSEAGFSWYEVSNWATDPSARCRHNELYWTDGDWWGIGPGAHSHVGGVRWWNRKHPAAYAARLAAGVSPAQGREVLSAVDQRVERVMLQLRLSTGLDAEELDATGRKAADRAVHEGLLSRSGGRIVPTLRGRLLVDGLVRRLLGWE